MHHAAATQTLAGLSTNARARIRFGGYVTGEPATEELRAAGLIRHAPEHVYRCGPDATVLTADGANVFSLVFTQPLYITDPVVSL